MNFLLDTHLLLWAAEGQLPPAAKPYIENESNTLFFSSASIWEVVIKTGLGRNDFKVNPSIFYHGLLGAGYIELPITSMHVLRVESLPDKHRDPFDRILLAQAIEEHCALITADSQLSRYEGPIIKI